MVTQKAVLQHILAAAVLAGLTCLTPLAAQDAAGLYKAKCAACHGADGKGDSPMGKKMGLRDFASPEIQKMSDDELTTIISDGKDKMPSYKKSLKPDQIKDLVAHIRSLAGK